MVVLALIAAVATAEAQRLASERDMSKLQADLTNLDRDPSGDQPAARPAPPREPGDRLRREVTLPPVGGALSGSGKGSSSSRSR